MDQNPIVRFINIFNFFFYILHSTQGIIIDHRHGVHLNHPKERVHKRWPWVVRLHFPYKSDTRCGGALISTNLVITAAHCVRGISSYNVSVIVGDVNLYHIDKEEVSLDVVNIILHPFSGIRKIYDKYDTVNVLEYDVNDIALLQLAGWIQCSKHVHPIQLPWVGVHGLHTDRFPPPTPLGQYKRCYVAGYGKTSFNGHYSNRLRSIPVQLIANIRCMSPDYYGQIIRPGMICAGDELGGWNSDACTGDSGGPLMCRSLHTEGGVRWRPWQIVGVVSWGYKCATENKPGVYADVGTYNFWIQREINKQSILRQEFLYSQKYCYMN